jgi:GTPase Era involved in 16S rRNA processing
MKNERPAIVLLGKTGNGKSTLGNFLLNDNQFKISGNLESETVDSLMGVNYKEDFCVIDTPGLNDSKGRDQIHYENIIKYIRDKYITSFLLVFNFQDTRLSSDLQELIKIYCNIFNFNIFNHMGLVFTKAFAKNEEILNSLISKKKNIFVNDVKNIIENFFNRSLNNDMPCFFVDADLEEIDDYSSEEREKIIKWAKNSSEADVNHLRIKENLRIKDKRRETRSEYSTSYSGVYKTETWYYYERYNETDINNNINYGSWRYYDSSSSTYQYKSSCIII